MRKSNKTEIYDLVTTAGPAGFLSQLNLGLQKIIQYLQLNLIGTFITHEYKIWKSMLKFYVISSLNRKLKTLVFGVFKV